MPYILSATGVTVYIHDFALRLELVMTVNRTRQCGQVLEAQDGNGVPIPTVVPTGAAPVRALQGCVLATGSLAPSGLMIKLPAAVPAIALPSGHRRVGA